MKNRYFFIAWIFCIAAIVYNSLLTAPGPPLFSMQDKVLHAAAYAVMTFCGIRGLRMRTIWVAAVGFCLGCAMEYAQSFIPGRDMSAWDQLANTAGIATGMMACMKFGGKAGRV